MAVSNLVAPQAGKTLKVASFTTPGSATFTLPSGYGVSNPLAAEVLLVGGGGAGGTGFWESSSANNLPGAGGGGAVKKLMLNLTQNMNVYVGAGGYAGRGPSTFAINGNSTYCSGNGQFSYIGNGTVKNMFINPQCVGVNGNNGAPYLFHGWNYQANSFNVTGITTNGGYIQNGSFDTYPQSPGQTYPVLPSTNYCFSGHFATTAAGQSTTVTTVMKWFTASGTFISESTNSFVHGSTPSRGYVGATSPSNAAYVILHLRYGGGYGGVNAGYFMFEQGVTTPSTYADGEQTGFAWSGAPNGSVTVSASDVMYVANGGGAGAGHHTYNNGNGGPWRLGYTGATSGGGSVYNTSTSNIAMTGAGGGAGGDAIPGTVTGIPYTTSAGAINAIHTVTSNTLCEFGAGAIARLINNGNDQMVHTNSIPGPGIDGYGRGGHATSARNNTSYVRFNSMAEYYKAAAGRANTGEGGSVLEATLGSGATAIVHGGDGGSGLVIIKYWE